MAHRGKFRKLIRPFRPIPQPQGKARDGKIIAQVKIQRMDHGPKRLGNLSDELGTLEQTAPADVIAEATNLCEPADQFVIAQRLDIGN